MDAAIAHGRRVHKRAHLERARSVFWDFRSAARSPRTCGSLERAPCERRVAAGMSSMEAAAARADALAWKRGLKSGARGWTLSAALGRACTLSVAARKLELARQLPGRRV